MLKIKRMAWVLLIMVLGLLLLTVSPTFAISNPDSISTEDIYVFRNVLSSGDQLYFVRYNINYTATPSESASDAFQMALYEEGNGSPHIRGLNYYGHNIISIYLSSSQALSWGGAHVVRVTGSPSLFGTLTEGVNMISTPLSGGDYKEASQLGAIMLAQAEALEVDLGTLLTDDGYLDATGTFYFKRAVNSLDVMAPEIFSERTTYASIDRTDYTYGYEEGLHEHQGPRLEAAIDDIGDLFGMGGKGTSPDYPYLRWQDE